MAVFCLRRDVSVSELLPHIDWFVIDKKRLHVMRSMCASVCRLHFSPSILLTSSCLCWHPLPVCLTVYLSLPERRSVVIGSCWMVWCSIRANKPARLVMAILRFLSCSNSSSSLYHWEWDRHRHRDRVTFWTPVTSVMSVTFVQRVVTTRTRSRSTSARRSFSQQ